jgi:hypothetical protein
MDTTPLLVSLLASPGFSGIKFGVKGGLSLALSIRAKVLAIKNNI